jgi:hypothetical protein
MKPLMSEENFYGLPDLPFNLHLGLEFDRAASGEPATLTLPRSAQHVDSDDATHRAAMYTVGEVAAAVSVLDTLVDALPVFLLTLGGSFRHIAPAEGAVRTVAVVEGAPENAVEELRARRKLPLASRVSLYDEADRLTAEMRIDFHARPLTKTLEAAFLTESGAS